MENQKEVLPVTCMDVTDNEELNTWHLKWMTPDNRWLTTKEWENEFKTTPFIQRNGSKASLLVKAVV